MEIPEKVSKLLTTRGFDQLFFKNLAKTKTQKEAYELTEQEYESYFRKKRYKSFDSYRKSRDSRLKVYNL